MSNYSNFFFIGSRGEYKNMPFEILGWGEVDYTIRQVADPEDSDDIGQSFPTHEYYCLANNGQTWYFAISGQEVYYCRQLLETEIRDLKLEPENFNPDSLRNTAQDKETVVIDPETLIQKIPLNPSSVLEEGGLGKLNKSEGRANKDFRKYPEFVYKDFEMLVGNKPRFFSLDVFPNGEREWFETVKIPDSELINIFQETLRINKNPKIDAILAIRKVFLGIAIACFAAASLLLMTGIYLEFQKKTIYERSTTITSTKDSEADLGTFTIQNPKKNHISRINVTLPKERGSSLDLILLENNQVINSSTYEFNHYTRVDSEGDESTNQEQSASQLFYPDSKRTFQLKAKMNDYGTVGVATETLDPVQIPISITIMEGGVRWLIWIIGIIALVILGIVFLIMRMNKQQELLKM